MQFTIQAHHALYLSRRPTTLRETRRGSVCEQTKSLTLTKQNTLNYLSLLFFLTLDLHHCAHYDLDTLL